METILIIATTSILNVVCFFIGAKIGQQTSQGETIQAPNINPIEYVEKQKEKREAQRQRTREQIILENIENYNGTSLGQKEVPR